MTVASLFAELGVDTSPMTGVARDVRNKLQPLQQTFQQVGTTLTQAITVPLAGAAAAAAKTGTAIDREFAQIEGLVGESREVLQGMRSDLLDISAATGRGPEELAQALFFVESAGFRGQDALNVLEQSAKAAAAGLGETKSVADAVTSAVNAYGAETLSAQRATDVLVSTVREGKVAADTIATSLGDVIPLASQMDVEFNEVGGTLAALTRVGASASKSTTSLAAIFRTLLKGSKKTRQGLDKMNLSLEGLRERMGQQGLLPTLKLLAERFEETDAEITDVFPNARALRGVLGLVGKNAEQAEQIFDSMNNEVGGATAKAFAAASDTIRNQFWRALREVQATLDEIYITFRSEIRTALSAVITVLKDMRSAWNSLSTTMQGAVVAAGAIAAALGPVLLTLSGIMAIAPAVGAAFSALGAAMPYVTALAGGAALVIANWESVEDFFTSGGGADLFDAIGDAAQGAQDALSTAFAGMRDAVLSIWDAFTQAFRSNGGILAMLGSNLIEVLEGAVQMFIPFANQFGAVMRVIGESVGNMVQFVSDLLTGDFAGAWDAVTDQLSTVKDFFLRTLANIADALLTFVETTLTTLPGVSVEFDGLRSSIREWRRSIGEDTTSVQSDFEATVGAMEKVRFKGEQMANDVTAGMKEAIKFATRMAREVRNAGDEAEDAASSVEDAASSMQDAFSVDAAGPVDTEEARKEKEREEQRKDDKYAGMTPEEVDGPGMSGMQQMIAKANESLKKMGQTLRRRVSQAFSNLITQGRMFGREINSWQDALQAFGDFAKQVMNTFIQKIIEAIIQGKALKDILGGSGGGKAGAIAAAGLSVAMMIGQITGGEEPDGSRATGGPVTSGRTYLVGESEPELFTPRSSGQVTPLSKMRATTRGAVRVELGQPRAMPNGDVQYSLEESERQESRRGFPG